MATLRKVQVNDADYGDDRSRIEAQDYDGEWVVPAWEEMGLGELSPLFQTRVEAQAALDAAAEWLPEYGFEAA
jgi:hypothetical protein